MARGIVLVVESDHQTRVTLRRVLEDNGYLVVSAANGNDALELLPGMSTPIVVFLAGQLLTSSGDKFLETFRSRSEFARIPIVQVKHGQEPNLSDIACAIHKPIDGEEVIACVDQALRSKRPNDHSM